MLDLAKLAVTAVEPALAVQSAHRWKHART
jgi:hypothetical protein